MSKKEMKQANTDYFSIKKSTGICLCFSHDYMMYYLFLPAFRIGLRGL